MKASKHGEAHCHACLFPSDAVEAAVQRTPPLRDHVTDMSLDVNILCFSKRLWEECRKRDIVYFSNISPGRPVYFLQWQMETGDLGYPLQWRL